MSERLSNCTILFYPANLVGFLRLGILSSVWLLIFGPHAAPHTLSIRLLVVVLLSLCALLDLLDGHLARKYGQATKFGALFDQLLDLLMHSTLWLLSGFAGVIPLLGLEWLAGIGVIYVTLFRQGYWKMAMARARSLFARSYFQNNQRNPLSILANVSHIVFPAALYLGPDFWWGGWLAAPGVIVYEIATATILLILLPAPPKI